MSMITYNQKEENKNKGDLKMTKADLENRLDELDTKEFLINMADRFTIKDRETLNAIDIERKRIFEILKKSVDK